MRRSTTKLVRIKNLGKIVTGSTPPTKQREYYGSDYLFVKPTDLKKGSRTVTKTEWGLSIEGAQLLKGRLIPENSTCVVTIGSLGKICMISEACFTNQAINSVIPDESQYDPLYVYYLLTYTIPKVKKLDSGTASGRENVSKGAFESIEIEVHDLKCQRKIGSILSAYDDLIENNHRRIQILEEMAMTIYRKWFVHFRFPGYKDVETIDSELGTIPDGWRIRNLSELVSTQYGYTESSKNEEVGPKYVRGMDINKTSYITWNRVPYCPIDDGSYEKYKLRVGDILIIRMADPGKIGIVEKEIDAVFASYLIRLKIRDDSLHPYFLFYTLSAERYQGYISGASTGTTRKSASAPIITNHEIVVPDSIVIDKFETTIESLRRLLNNLLDQNAVLERTRNLLLPKLVSGKIDVTSFTIDTSSTIHQKSKYEKQSTIDSWLGDEEDD